MEKNQQPLISRGFGSALQFAFEIGLLQGEHFAQGEIFCLVGFIGKQIPPGWPF